MSHRFCLTAAAALLAAGPALAGGFSAPVVTPPVAVPVAPPPVVATSDWSGGYVGGQIGRGSLVVDETSSFGPAEDAFEGSGTLFGLHAGYQAQFGAFVAGAELDWDSADLPIDGTETGPTDDVIGTVDSIARAKLRLGFAAGRFLPYVTAGLARASIDPDDSELPAAIDESYDGRFVGIGASYRLSDRFAVGVEALRHDFDDAFAFSDELAAAEYGTFEMEIDTVTLRGSFRF